MPRDSGEAERQHEEQARRDHMEEAIRQVVAKRREAPERVIDEERGVDERPVQVAGGFAAREVRDPDARGAGIKARFQEEKVVGDKAIT